MLDECKQERFPVLSSSIQESGRLLLRKSVTNMLCCQLRGDALVLSCLLHVLESREVLLIGRLIFGIPED